MPPGIGGPRARRPWALARAPLLIIPYGWIDGPLAEHDLFGLGAVYQEITVVSPGLLHLPGSAYASRYTTLASSPTSKPSIWTPSLERNWVHGARIEEKSVLLQQKNIIEHIGFIITEVNGHKVTFIIINSLVLDMFSKQAKSHSKFLALPKLFSTNKVVSSAYCRDTIPPG
jgi:hypothetical protein